MYRYNTYTFSPLHCSGCENFQEQAPFLSHRYPPAKDSSVLPQNSHLKAPTLSCLPPGHLHEHPHPFFRSHRFRPDNQRSAPPYVLKLSESSDWSNFVSAILCILNHHMQLSFYNFSSILLPLLKIESSVSGTLVSSVFYLSRIFFNSATNVFTSLNSLYTDANRT